MRSQAPHPSPCPRCPPLPPAPADSCRRVQAAPDLRSRHHGAHGDKPRLFVRRHRGADATQHLVVHDARVGGKARASRRRRGPTQHIRKRTGASTARVGGVQATRHRLRPPLRTHALPSTLAAGDRRAQDGDGRTHRFERSLGGFSRLRFEIVPYDEYLVEFINNRPWYGMSGAWFPGGTNKTQRES